MRRGWLCVLVLWACDDGADDASPDVSVAQDGAIGGDDAAIGGDAANLPDAAPRCADVTCESGMMCVAGACVAGCSSNDHCTDGTFCSAGVCVDCESDDDCTDNTICEAGACVLGCRGDADCDEGLICSDSQCAPGCRADEACAAGEICEDSTCSAGCRADADCGAGRICADDLCVLGCRDDDGCAPGNLCTDGACLPGCRDDGGCESGSICEASRCELGCRDDAGCSDERLCFDLVCEARGVRCRVEEDCRDVEDCEATQCVPAGPECVPDDGPSDDSVEDAGALPLGVRAGLNICGGDADHYRVEIAAGWTLTVVLEFARERGALQMDLLTDNGVVLASGGADNNRDVLVYESPAAVTAYVRVAGAVADVSNTYALSSSQLEPAPMCVDTDLYADSDGDGFGDGDALNQCLDDPAVPGEGFALAAGDCAVDDPWANPGATEICGDNVDDDCVGDDADCPETQPGVQVPDWDCVGEPPANVAAWARFADGDGYFQDGGCFYFFEGLPGEFYVKRNLERVNQDPSCDRINGCVCPSLDGRPSYDRRMYAFTLSGAPEACAEIVLRDHAGEEQIVSNACRKYLYQLHFYDIPYSLVAPSMAEFERRLALYPTVEVACARDSPHAYLPYQTLLTTVIERNANFQPLE